MILNADTSVLLRYLLNDDLRQGASARRAVDKAEFVIITLPALCELVWVLDQGYKISKSDIVHAIDTLLAGGNIQVNREAAAFGLEQLASGGDFADAVIAFEGHMLKGAVFTSFDKKAVHALKKRGLATKLLPS